MKVINNFVIYRITADSASCLMDFSVPRLEAGIVVKRKSIQPDPQQLMQSWCPDIYFMWRVKYSLHIINRIG